MSGMKFVPIMFLVFPLLTSCIYSNEVKKEEVRHSIVQDLYVQARIKAETVSYAEPEQKRNTIDVPWSVKFEPAENRSNTISNRVRPDNTAGNEVVVITSLSGGFQPIEAKDEEKEAQGQGQISAESEADSTDSVVVEEIKIYMDGPVAANQGTQFDITVNLANAIDVVSAPFYLRYDPLLLKYIKSTEGDFMKSDGNPTSFLVYNDVGKKRLLVGLSRLGDDSGIGGSGKLMKITFSAIKSGDARLFFDNVTVLGAGSSPLNVSATGKILRIE